MNCALPGGLWFEGQVLRASRLHPITGRIEQGLADCVADAPSWPAFVSAALAMTVESVDGLVCSPEMVETLSVADRQYLLLFLSRLLFGDDFWVSVRCASCGAYFDLGLKRSALPIKRAGQGYPFANVDCGGHRVRLRVPAGADQHCLVDLPETEAIRVLVQRCVADVDGGSPDADFAIDLEDADIDRIQAALDDVAADVGTLVQTRCPECAAEHIVSVDPYATAEWQGGELYQDVHLIAGRYHWSEPEILALPRGRRQLYLALIERERGLYQ